MATEVIPAQRGTALQSALRSGPVLMTLATLSFCVMVAAVKVARTELGPLEIITWRGVVSVPLAATLAWGSGFRMGRRGVFMLRAILGFAAMVCFFTAAKGLPLADLSLITRLQPIMVALIAPLALGATERTSFMVWVALGVGLAGCAILIGPEFYTATPGDSAASSATQYGLWALAATTASAGAHTAVRALGRTETPRTVVFWFQLTNVPFAMGALLAFSGELPRFPPPHLLGAVFICGVAATAGQLLMTKAYQQDRAAIVAAASYSGPLWSVGLDLMIFGLAPSWTMAAGGALVVAAGYLLYRSEN